jgi:aryl-alcohol dehydrogenase-like predicted oxidoreductase
MSYGDPRWREWVLDEQAAQPFFRRAVEAGINFFDTADTYSNGRSEEITGRALAALTRRDEIVIATKVYSPMGEGPNRAGLSRKHIVQSCEGSLRRLGIEAIDLYQIHRFDEHVPIDETLEALNDLVRAGKVRYIGGGSGSAWRMAQALSRSERHGWARFISMQNHYNLLYREEEREMIPLCRHEGVGIVPWSPLARGLLTRPPNPDRNPRGGGTSRARTDNLSPSLYDHPSDWEVIAAVERIAAARSATMAEVAMAWVLSRPGVTAPIVGATRLEHLESALRALDIRLTADECAALEAPYRPHEVRGHSA